MANEAVRSGWKVRQFYAVEGWQPPSAGIPLEIISNKELEQASTLQTPNKVIAVIEIPETDGNISPADKGLHLMLDRISDPGNFGTIMRIADWFGISSLICSPDTVELYNPKAVQSSMGSLFRVPVIYTSLTDMLIRNNETHRLPVFAMELAGKNIYASPLANSAFILMGNESRGVDPMLKPFITESVKIPPAIEKGTHAESLNVSIAAGIICAEFRRRLMDI